MNTNTKDYWNNRFETDWNSSYGSEQTSYFGEIMLQNIPKDIVQEIQLNKMTIMDIGCAEGDFSNKLSNYFDVDVIGVDFSECAINNAKSKYQNVEFIKEDINAINIKSDIIVVSNVLEHFENPWNILKKLQKNAEKYIFVMVPINEIYSDGEHIYKFNGDNIQSDLSDYYLKYYKVLDCYEMDSFYMGFQILLIYENKKFSKNISIEQNLNNEINKAMNDFNLKVKKLITDSSNYEYLKKEFSEMKKDFDNYKNINEQQEKSYERVIDIKNEEIKKLTLELNVISKEHSIFSRDLYNLRNSKSYKIFKIFIAPPLDFSSKVIKKIYRTFVALFTLNITNLKNELYLSSLIKKINKFSNKKKNICKKIKDDIKGKRVVVLPPTIDWTMPLLQRPQQLAKAYARKDNTIVIYLTGNLAYDNVEFAEKYEENLWLCNEYTIDYKVLNEILPSAQEVIFSVSWTPNKRYLDNLNCIDKVIYEYIDELEIFHMYGPEMEKDHAELLSKADVTVSTATKLYDMAKDIAKNPILSTNGGDFEFFKNTKNTPINRIIAEKVKDYKVVLGYYGALASWYDYELVKDVARKHPDWLWVLVGLNYDNTLDSSGIECFDNIIYTGPQPYDQLPSFLRAFDIATIPFVINEITLSTSPVKLFEYMSGGKPIITSKMPECLKYESCKIYETTEEFCQHVKDIVDLKEDDEYWKTLEKEAKENTWDAKTDEILEALK